MRVAKPFATNRRRRKSKVAANVIENVWRYCHRNRISVSQFCDDNRINWASLRAAELGKQSDFYGQTLIEIADILGISLDKLVGRE
jgi:hypothetical protein